MPTTLLKLGRVSNLPTVLTNVLAGTVIAGGVANDWRSGIALVAMSLFYIGGMYLNDYFDREVDVRDGRGRPIATGQITAATVFAVGSGLLALGLILMVPLGPLALAVGALLALVILFYDRFHHRNPLAPAVMGLCRTLVYCGAAVGAVGSVSLEVAITGTSLLAYVAGITYAARQESLDHVANLWPLALLAGPILLGVPAVSQGLIPVLALAALCVCVGYCCYLLALRPVPGAVSRAVGMLIAGISLVDAVMLARSGAVAPALVAMAGFPATLLLQKYIPGT
jgi:4-hydroxybenzoate polyprenyltransferase